jgi:hypothetical protein
VHDAVPTRRVARRNQRAFCQFRDYALETRGRACQEREAIRRENAVRRAQARETEIVRLQEALEYQQKRNEILESFAASAKASVSHMQQITEQLEHQLSTMRLQRDHVSERVSKTAAANKALVERNKAVKKEMETSKHECAEISISIHDSIERSKEKAGLALIQRDLAVAQLQVPNTSSTSTTFQNRDLIHAVEERKLPTVVLGQRSGAKAIRQMHTSFMSSEPVRRAKSEITTEQKIETLEVQNLALTAANRHLTEQYEGLLRVNKGTLAKVRDYKQALERLCQRLGIEVKELGI